MLSLIYLLGCGDKDSLYVPTNPEPSVEIEPSTEPSSDPSSEPSTEPDTSDPSNPDTGPVDTGLSDTAVPDIVEIDISEYLALSNEVCSSRDPYFVAVTGTLTADISICAQDAVVLIGSVTMFSGTTMQIEAGSAIQMQTSAQLIIEAGATLNALGSESDPILFHVEDADVGSGRWAGLVIRGNGRNRSGGGSLSDSSGTLRYLRIIEAGETVADYSAALTFENVGEGTTVEYIEIWRPLDDAVSLISGDVNLSYIILYRPGDDAIDWTDGYRGTISHAAIAMKNGDRAIEGENRDPTDGPSTEMPISDPTMENISVYGGKKSALYLRNGSAGTVVNSVLNNNSKCAMEVSADVNFAASFSHLIVYEYDQGMYCTSANSGNASNYAANIVEIDPMQTGFMPDSSSPLLGNGYNDPTVSTYLGAFETTDWTLGWSKFDGRSSIY